MGILSAMPLSPAEEVARPISLPDVVTCMLPQLSARVWRDLDENGGLGWADFFTETGVFDFNGRLTSGRDELRAHFALRRQAGPRVTAHLITNVFCEPTGDGTARVGASICVFGGDGTAPLPVAPPTLVGLADDAFERQKDGRWLIARRSFRPSFYSPQDRIGRRVANG